MYNNRNYKSYSSLYTSVFYLWLNTCSNWLIKIECGSAHIVWFTAISPVIWVMQEMVGIRNMDIKYWYNGLVLPLVYSRALLYYHIPLCTILPCQTTIAKPCLTLNIPCNYMSIHKWHSCNCTRITRTVKKKQSQGGINVATYV